MGAKEALIWLDEGMATYFEGVELGPDARSRSVASDEATPEIDPIIREGGPAIEECGNDDGFWYALGGLGHCSNRRSHLVYFSLRLRSSANDRNNSCRVDAVDISTDVSCDCDGDGIPTECETMELTFRRCDLG